MKKGKSWLTEELPMEMFIWCDLYQSSCLIAAYRNSKLIPLAFCKQQFFRTQATQYNYKEACSVSGSFVLLNICCYGRYTVYTHLCWWTAKVPLCLDALCCFWHMISSYSYTEVQGLSIMLHIILNLTWDITLQFISTLFY